MTFRESVIRSTEFPMNYEMQIMGRGLDIREYKPPFMNIEDVVEKLLRRSKSKNAYRNYMIWELRWVSYYSIKDLAILCGIGESAIRQILRKIDNLVFDNQAEWFNNDVQLVERTEANDLETD